jgi:hypothetical protein
MPVRRFAFWVFLPLLAASAAARAADTNEPRAPTLLVRIKSIDDLIADGKYLARLGGEEDRASQVHGFLQSMVGDKGLEGIDVKRPLGLFGTLNGEPGGAALVPVVDDKAVLSLLERFGIKAEKDKDDIYAVSSENFPIPVPVYLRFANKYAYVAVQSKSLLTKGNLPDPEKLLAGSRATASAAFRLDQVPEGFKQFALAHVELRLSEQQEKEIPGETKAQRALRAQIVKNLSKQLASVIREGGALNVFFDVDRTAQQLVVEATLTGKHDSALRTTIQDLGQATSLFGGWHADNAAVNLRATLTLPESIRKALGPVITEGIRKETEKEADEAKRERARKFLEALEPTLRAGEIDVALSLRGPSTDKHYAFVAGAKVKDGKAIDAAFQEAVQGLPEGEKANVKLNAETVQGATVHRLDMQKALDDEGRRLLGENPFFLAMRADSVVIAGGEGGLTALKEALAAEPKAGAKLLVEVSMAKLAPLLSRGNAKAQEKLDKTVQESFKGGSDADKLRLTVEGGESLKLRLTLKADALKFMNNVRRDMPGHGLERSEENGGR